MQGIKRDVIIAFILAAIFVLIVVILQFLPKEPTHFIYQFF